MHVWSPTTVGINPILSDFKGPGTSKLDWRYLEHNKIDRNELQVRKNLHKCTGTKMAKKLNNLTEKNRFPNFCEPGVHSFLTLLRSKYHQSNFEVPGSCGSLSWGLSFTVLCRSAISKRSTKPID